MKAWFQRPHNEQSWQNFKDHFQDELKKLKKVLGPSIRATSYHTANFIPNEVKKEINDIKTEVANVEEKILQAVAENNSYIQDLTTSQAYHNHHFNQETQDKDENANVATQNNFNSDIIKLMQNLQSEINQMKMKLGNSDTIPPSNQIPPTNPTFTPWNPIQGRGQGGRGRGGQGRGNPRRKNTKFYCWTHGACAHNSQYCEYPAEGHQWNATFANKMEGNTSFCPPTKK